MLECSRKKYFLGENKIIPGLIVFMGTPGCPLEEEKRFIRFKRLVPVLMENNNVNAVRWMEKSTPCSRRQDVHTA